MEDLCTPRVLLEISVETDALILALKIRHKAEISFLEEAGVLLVKAAVSNQGGTV